MKKLLSILVIGVVVFLPLTAHAAGRITGSCEKSERCEDGTCQSTCTIRVEGNTDALTTFEGDFVFTPSGGAEIASVTPGEGWTNLNGTDWHMSFLASGEPISASDFVLATVVLNVNEDVTGCTLQLTNPSVGTEIEIEIDVTEEVETGATLPLTILACGIGAGAVIYVVTKKNKKLYKI